MKRIFHNAMIWTLSLCLILTSLPIVGNITSLTASAIPVPTITKLTKESDPDYDPVFTWDEVGYHEIINKSSDIRNVGKLPDYDEFKLLTGYTGLSQISLTEFRNIYGIGNNFAVPSGSVEIAICNENELDLFSSLVNNTADSETVSEQNYYSHASYALATEIKYTSNKFVPIGNSTYPFNGHFDGGNFTIKNLKIIQESSSEFNTVGYFGLFGYIGNDGIINNLGISAMTITLPYVVSADVGFLSGRNYGEIRNCFVNGKQTSIMNISNSTAGGITAENYGLISGCYADAWINVDTSAGNYSEPQPIATVNNGTVTNCYYIKHGVFVLCKNTYIERIIC